MTEDIGVETSTDLIDMQSDLFYSSICCCELVNLHLVLQNMRLNGLVLTKEFGSITHIVLHGHYTSPVLFLVSQDNQDYGILFDLIHILPEI